MIDILVVIYVVSVVICLVDFVRHYYQNTSLGFLSTWQEFLLTVFLVFTPVINTIVALVILF